MFSVSETYVVYVRDNESCILDSSDRPKIDLIGGGERLKAGQNISLLCSAEGGNPPPRLFWSTQDGSVINSTYQYDFTNQVKYFTTEIHSITLSIFRLLETATILLSEDRITTCKFQVNCIIILFLLFIFMLILICDMFRAYECSSFNRENVAPLKKSIMLHVDCQFISLFAFY